MNSDLLPDLLRRVQYEVDALYAQNASLKAEIKASQMSSSEGGMAPWLLPQKVPPPSVQVGMQDAIEALIFEETNEQSDPFSVKLRDETDRGQPFERGVSTLSKAASLSQFVSNGEGNAAVSETPFASSDEISETESMMSNNLFRFNFDTHDEIEYDLEESGRGSISSKAINMGGRLQRSCFNVNARVVSVLDSTSFDLFVGCIILMNTVFMALELQYIGLHAGYTIGFEHFDRPADELWPGAEDVFVTAERVFTVIFTLELTVRIIFLRCKVFMTPFNWLDIFAVIISLIDWLLSSSLVVKPLVTRMLRLAKVARGLRLAKLTKVVGSLHILLKSISASISTLSWSVLVLTVVQCIAGMIISQMVQDYILDESEDLENRRKVFSYYGTFSRSIITMFEVHLANFAPACRILVDYVGEGYAYAFLAYRCFAGFAILNVINAVFIQQTMLIAQQDQDIMMEQKRRAGLKYAKSIRKLFTALDSSGDGNLSLEELKSSLQQPDVKLWMSSLDLDTHDLEGLYNIIDVHQRGEISADELLMGSNRIKGPAKSVDMLSLMGETRRISLRVDYLLKNMESQTCRQGEFRGQRPKLNRSAALNRLKTMSAIPSSASFGRQRSPSGRR